MKKRYILFVFLAFFMVTFTIQDAKAQFSVGAGLTYGSDIEELGINLRAGYGFSEKLDAYAKYSIFFVEEGLGFSTLNFDGHYNFYSANMLDVYGLGGLNITFLKIDEFTIPGVGTFGGDLESEIGINLGGGVKYNLSEKFGLFGELKYVIGDADQVVVSAGALYSF